MMPIRHQQSGHRDAGILCCSALRLCGIVGMSYLVIILVVLLVVLVTLIGKNLLFPRPTAKPINLNHIGDVTSKVLQMHSGYDPFRQILVAIKGVVYDVTPARDLFSPGKELHVYAGKEVSRALAIGSLEESDCNDNLEDLKPEQLETLQNQIVAYSTKYEVVGKVVPLKKLTLEELGQYDGTNPQLPLYLSIRGVVYDISKGKNFYGPDGIYPFAGREVARAFALNSMADEDCTDKLDDLSKGDLRNLGEWEDKFNYKYPIIGVLEPGVPATAVE